MPAWIAGLRLKDTKCFCLCGAYNDSDKEAFTIGSGKTISITHGGMLSFFANDVPAHSNNNKGSVELEVLRVK